MLYMCGVVVYGVILYVLWCSMYSVIGVCVCVVSMLRPCPSPQLVGAGRSSSQPSALSAVSFAVVLQTVLKGSGLPASCRLSGERAFEQQTESEQLKGPGRQT